MLNYKFNAVKSQAGSIFTDFIYHGSIGFNYVSFWHENGIVQYLRNIVFYKYPILKGINIKK